jgi:hypothetical protein
VEAGAQPVPAFRRRDATVRLGISRVMAVGGKGLLGLARGFGSRRLQFGLAYVTPPLPPP